MNLPEIVTPFFPRKVRTAGHVLADVSFNHVERHVLRCGWVLAPNRRDYGVDAFLFTYSSTGRVEGGLIYLQLKATTSPKQVASGEFLALRVDRKDWTAWRAEVFPVILVLYDATRHRAFWLHVQKCTTGEVRRSSGSRTLTVRIPTSQKLTAASIRRMRHEKERIASLLRPILAHERDGFL